MASPAFCAPLNIWWSSGALTAPGPVTDNILTLSSSGTRAPERWRFGTTVPAIGGTLTILVGGVSQTSVTHAAGGQTIVDLPPGAVLTYTPNAAIPAGSRWLATREPWSGEQLA